MSEVVETTLAENLESFCENRAHIYGLLSRFYGSEINEELAQMVIHDFEFVSDDNLLNNTLYEMRADLEDIDEEGIERLAVLFNRAFFGMGPKTAQKAFPYESVYTSSEGIMMQEAFASTIKAYQEARYIKNPDFPEPEDHIAVQLAFVARLCEECAAQLQDDKLIAAEKLFEEQRDFLIGHLLNWIEPFVGDLQKSVEDGFYYHLAAFTFAFLSADKQELDEVLS